MAKALLKIDAIMQGLCEMDQSRVAFEVYRSYYKPEGVHKESTNGGQVQASLSQLDHNVVASSASSSKEASNKPLQYFEETREAIDFLNSRTGKHFRKVETNLVLVRNCLKSGATLEDIKGVIARKVRQWKGNPEMEEYLRPSTLFNKTKFENYLGEQRG